MTNFGGVGRRDGRRPDSATSGIRLLLYIKREEKTERGTLAWVELKGGMLGNEKKYQACVESHVWNLFLRMTCFLRTKTATRSRGVE